VQIVSTTTNGGVTITYKYYRISSPPSSPFSFSFNFSKMSTWPLFGLSQSTTGLASLSTQISTPAHILMSTSFFSRLPVPSQHKNSIVVAPTAQSSTHYFPATAPVSVSAPSRTDISVKKHIERVSLHPFLTSTFSLLFRVAFCVLLFALLPGSWKILHHHQLSNNRPSQFLTDAFLHNEIALYRCMFHRRNRLSVGNLPIRRCWTSASCFVRTVTGTLFTSTRQQNPHQQSLVDPQRSESERGLRKSSLNS